MGLLAFHAAPPPTRQLPSHLSVAAVEQKNQFSLMCQHLGIWASFYGSFLYWVSKPLNLSPEEGRLLLVLEGAGAPSGSDSLHMALTLRISHSLAFSDICCGGRHPWSDDNTGERAGGICCSLFVPQLST